MRGDHRSCPDAIVFNAIIDALWDTGVISRSAKVDFYLHTCLCRSACPLHLRWE